MQRSNIGFDVALLSHVTQRKKRSVGCDDSEGVTRCELPLTWQRRARSTTLVSNTRNISDFFKRNIVVFSAAQGVSGIGAVGNHLALLVDHEIGAS